VNSAGNQANRHYEGTYTNTYSTAWGWHEFSTNPVDEVLNLTATKGERITLLLSWDDWEAVDQDYDLHLLDWTLDPENPVANSTDYQDGTPGQMPIEYIDILAPETGNYYVAINEWGTRGDAHLELYSYDTDFPEYNVNSSSLMIPADAGGVMAVGATYWGDDSLEPFSSQGPTNDNRTKPDVVAPDGVSSSIYGNSTGNRDADWASGDSFFGTSASCPHTAGAAALLLSANPSLNNTELRYYLESSAKDLDHTGKDNRTGSGRVDVYAAYQEATSRAFTPADAVIALRVAVRGEYEKFLDVNSDGAVTSLDALMILQAAGGVSI
jgi:subtilisin family serine protease